MSLSYSLEHVTANVAFWLHKLYALPVNADHLRKQVGLSNAVRAAEVPSDIFPKRHFLCELKRSQGLSK